MQKFKSLNWNMFFNLIKCCLIGIISTLIGTVILAFILKFANLSSTLISYINDIIKVFSIFIMVMCIKRKNGDKLLFKALFSGVLYAIFSFIIFSILNGNFNINLSFVYDLLFSVIVSAIVSVVINILSHKNL